jgi:hypothetical protein
MAGLVVDLVEDCRVVEFPPNDDEVRYMPARRAMATRGRANVSIFALVIVLNRSLTNPDLRARVITSRHDFQA